MAVHCTTSKETIDACNKQATQYEVVLRGDMTMGVPNEEASINYRIQALERNLKGLEHLEDKIKDDKQLTLDFIQEEKKRLDTVECREKRGRQLEAPNNDESGVDSSGRRRSEAKSKECGAH